MPLALMGVRCFWPQNMIGHEGLVINQAWKLRSLPTNHQFHLASETASHFSLGRGSLGRVAKSRRGQIVLLPRQHGPGGPRRFVGERDNRPIKASPCREPLQPLGPTVVVLRQSEHHGAGAMNHLTSEIVIGTPAYSAKPRFASGRVLTRHKANPRRKFPPRTEMATIVDSGDERRCDHRTHAGQLRKAPTRFVRPAKPQELLIQLFEPAMEGAKFVEEIAEELSREIGKLGSRDGVLRLLQEPPCALG